MGPTSRERERDRRSRWGARNVKEPTPVLRIKEIGTYGELVDWYDGYFSVHGTWATSESYANALIKMLLRSGATHLQVRRLLDVACGGGFFLSFSRDTFRSVSGCDISQAALAEARRRCSGGFICQANAEALPHPDGCFDVVTCLGALEHFTGAAQSVARNAPCRQAWWTGDGLGADRPSLGPGRWATNRDCHRRP